jgi:Ca2+-binding RTX toxin-like protein
VVDNASDAVFENTDEGEDLVESSVNYTLSANVEKLTLTGTAVSAMGNSLTNTLTGNASANSLDGGSGIDSMVGGAGNDTYFVDNVGDVVFENASEGTDVVVTTVDGYTMASEIENLVIGGTGNLAGSGSAGNNLLTGNSGNNLLTGNGGNDTFIGGEGNDTLVGDTGADSMVGGVGADSMVGGGGADTFVGGAGNDTIVVSFGDAVTVDGGADNDTVKFESSIGRTVGDTFFGGFSNIESYDFTSVTGNVDITIGLNAQNLGIATLAGGTANSTLTANSSYSGSVHFTGGALADSLTGNSGNDTLAGAGENDTIVGGSGADSLDGGTGNDSMVGGTGNDTYVVDSALDVIVENASEGTDVVRSSVSYTLGSNIESLELTGTANIDGTGDALANTITGNSGNNVLAGEGGNDTLIGGAGNDSLDGGIGNDSMVGGAGDDTFVVDSATDVVVEAAGDGTDLVQTGISYTLGSNFENLELTGTSNINGTGNDLDNSITGNSGNNTLAGGDGNDTISGGGGDDSLYGGAGGDSLVGGSGNDTLKAGTGNDHMDGGDNDDSFLFSSDTQVLANTVVGGAGTDTLVLTAATTITDPQLVRVSGVEVLQASSLAGNSITLGANALASGVSTLKGGAAGGDTLSAAGYTGTNAKIWIDASGSTLGSTLIAGLGDPAFTGGNTLLGGLGSDLIQVATSAVLNNASIIGGTGTDTVQVTTDAQVVGDTDLDSLSGIEALQLANGANSITLGDKARGIATVTGGLDIIAMGSGSDTLTATAAFGTTAITLDGGAGDDRFVFDTATQMAAATLLGGTGTDTLALAQATVLGNGTAFLNVTGMDVLQAAATGESSFVLDASAQAAGIRTVIGGSGKGTLNASAYSVDVTLDASANANTTANNGATLLGGTGNNSFRMLNNNVLSVSSIVGGSASDTLSFTQDGLSITDGNFTRVQGVEALRTGNGTNYVNLGSNAATAGLKTLVGGTGADTLDAAAFSGATLAIDSGNGADFITGSSTAANSILSGAGNDSITLANAAAVGRSTVVGGADTDTLSLAGNDTLTDAQLANVSGVEVLSAAATGNSSLTVGTNAQALGLRIVLGGGGNDTLNAVAFTAGVTLNGGAGNDSLLVSSGAILGQSSVVGGIGTDTLALTIDALSITDADFTRVSTVEVFKTANGNNRVLLGTAAQTAGIATVVGGSGKDTLDANAFTQALVLDGGQGDNSLFGGAGNDSLISYDGADALDGGVGIDTMIGGKGSDTYYLGDDDEWIVENEATGAGANYIIVQDNVSSYNTLTGGGDATFVVSALVEQIGTDGNDTLVGTPLKDTISGLGGDDVITGDRGADSLLGGDGNDSISGGGASDTILGGANNDTLLGDAGSDSIEGGDGTDSIFGGADNDTILGNNGNDTLLGEAGSDSILGGDGFDSILGGADNDTILGGNDNDTILGGDGNDSILGGIGNDSLIAGTGIDTLDGEDGDDTFVADATGTSRFLGGDGNDNFRFSTPSLVGLNTIVGDDGNDTISTDTIWLLAGGTLNDADLLHVSAIEVLDASGLNAENAITANLGVSAFSAGISTLTGSNQADYLSAAEYISGSIWIRGYNGATSNGDSLVAGSGSNSSTLVGSNEADYFEVGLASLVGNHSIDGGSGTDTLSIKNIAYGQAGWNPGNQVFSDADFTKVRNIERLQYDNRYQNTLVFGENLAAAFSGDIFIYSTTETNPSDGIGDDGRDVIDLSGITSITKKVNLDVRHEVFGATITAATTNGTLMGGSGVFADDLFIFEQASWLSGAMIVGGDGEDTLRIQGNGYFGLNDINTADFKIDIDVLDITGAGNEIILTTDPDNTDITTVVGGSGPNTFTAASYGGLGAKTLYWDMRRSDGGDSIVGAATNDYFQIRNGSNLQNSIITGGTGGTDTLALLSGGETLGDAIFDNASNLDVLVLGSAANGNNITLGATHAQTAGIATVIGGTRSETINASAYTTAIYIDASASSGARLQGSSTANANTLIGASAGSNEFEVGSLGSNSIVGGASGVDTLTFVNSTDIEDLIQNSQINDLSTASLSNIGVLKFTGNDNDITLGNDGLAAGIRTLVGGEGGDLGSTFDTSLYGTVGVVFQVTDQVYLKNSNITGGTGVDTLKFSRDGVSITDENVANLRNIDVLRTANGNNRFLFDDDYLTAGIETIIGGTGRDTIDMASNVLYTPGSDADIITVDLSAGSGYTLISSTGNFRWAKVIGGSATGSVILDGTSLADADFANMYQANIGSIFMRSGSNNTVVLGENALASGLDALTMSLGNDFINASGFAGTLAISGGAGNDRVETSFASLSNLTYTGGEGVDRLQLVGAEARSFTSLAGNFEVLELNAGNNFVILGNDASLSAIHGGTGIDTISMLSNTTGIEFVMDATRLGATAGFASLDGGSGMDTLTVRSVDTTFVDNQFARVGSVNWADDIGAIENFVTEAGVDDAYTFGRNAYDAGIRNVYAGARQVLNAAAFNDGDPATTNDRALNFVFDTAANAATANITGTSATGNDTLTLTTDGQTVNNATFANKNSVETLVLANGANTVTLQSNAHNSGLRVVVGGSGADIFNTSDAAYTLAASLVGGAGNDSFVAGSGNDTLVGTNSTAVGANERDTLTGGLGNDRFVLGDSNNAYYNTAVRNGDYAVITDFGTGTDIIQLKDLSAIITNVTARYGYLMSGVVDDVHDIGDLGIGIDSYLYADSDNTGTITINDNLIAVFNNTDGVGGALTTADLTTSRFSIV